MISRDKEIIQVVLEISQRLRDPVHVEAFNLNDENKNSRPLFDDLRAWSGFSLTDGYPGLILLFSALRDTQLLSDEDGNIVHRYVLALKDSIESSHEYISSSFFGGVAGVCYAVQHASRGDNSYHKFLHTLHQYILLDVKNNYLAPIQQSLNDNAPSASSLWDVISGICGIGRYLLTALSFEPFIPLLNDVLSTVVKFCLPIKVDEFIVPGWFLTKDDVLNQRTYDENSIGNFNLGLAHGAPGLLAFLSFSMINGVEVSGQKEAIVQLSCWLKNKSLYHNNEIIWPYVVSFEEEVGLAPKSSAPKLSRDAWCYGVPGVARSLYIAGKALDDVSLKQFAKTAFEGVFARSRERWEIPGPGLCHGLSGLLLIAHEMCREPGCEDLKPHVDDLTRLLLEQYSAQNAFGFRDIEVIKGGGVEYVDKIGFLEGVTGVLLTLLSCSHVENNMHYASLPLLIS